MHVALNGWFWQQPHSGSGQYLHQLLRALTQLPAPPQLTLVLPPGVAAGPDLPAGVEAIATQGARGRLGKVIFEQHSYPRAVAACNADIAHVPYHGAPLRSPAPLVTTVLDVVALVIPQYARRPPARLYTALVGASARGSAQVITLSEAAKLDIEEHLDLPPARITVTWLAPDDACHPRLGAERDEAVRARYGLPARYVLAIGGFDLRKQFRQLLQAWTWVAQAEGADCTLVIAGREPQWREPLFPDLRALARDLDISEHILWTGDVAEADKPSLYRMARVFAFPSRYEGFGLPVLEAMACGTPVVANEISCLPELVEDAAYLVEPGNARAMAGAILALLNQEPLRQALRNAGLARATRFSWRQTAQQTLNVYEQVLAAR